MASMTTVLAASLALAAGVGTPSPGQGAVSVSGTFRKAAVDAGYGAVTYAPGHVPAGSRIRVTERAGTQGTWIELRLEGVKANRTFGAHVHRKPCGTDPAAAGSHYQDLADPVQPSVDPAYANPRNEVWLDLTTDARGDGRSQTAVTWRIRVGDARSVVVHEHPTATGPGHAGSAGPRLACLTVPFV
ncbi:superoxide dismutase family protein [Streptomyces sp. NPDC047718]|uniref:superoxide dismutase family protein n=1 Tax=Streptomyces sp. NPDC047718 TaxID=3155479 RepID=UPI0034048D58